MAGTQKAIISWGVGKRNGESTIDFLHDLRSRVIGQPEISTDGFLPYHVAIRDAFGDNASHSVIVRTYSVRRWPAPLLRRRGHLCRRGKLRVAYFSQYRQ